MTSHDARIAAVRHAGDFTLRRLTGIPIVPSVHRGHDLIERAWLFDQRVRRGDDHELPVNFDQVR
jgi:hypothetical protein